MFNSSLRSFNLLRCINSYLLGNLCESEVNTLLDKSTVKILRYIQTHPNISLFDLKESFSDCNKNISYLCKEEYISNNIKGYSGVTCSAIHSNSFSITPKGSAYLENLPKQAFFKIYPLVISTSALLVSILALLKSFGIIFI